MNLPPEQAILRLAATGLGVVVGYCILLVVGARARLHSLKAHVVRSLLAVLGATIITAVGWLFFMFGIHRPTPVQTRIAWAGVPFVMATLDRPMTDLAVWLALLSGVALWAVVLYGVLYLAKIPGRLTQRQG